MTRHNVGRFMVAVQDHDQWVICNKRTKDPLGGIAYYEPWQCFIFEPLDVHFSPGCLRAVAKFLEGLKRERMEPAVRRAPAGEEKP